MVFIPDTDNLFSGIHIRYQYSYLCYSYQIPVLLSLLFIPDTDVLFLLVFILDTDTLCSGIHKEYNLPFAEMGVGKDLRLVKKEKKFNEVREEILTMIWDMEEEIMGRQEDVA